MRVRVASAGTGKTTSLVVRVLELVAGGTPLRRIAAVTYTRTAAAELRQRVGEGVRALLAEGAYLDGVVRLDGDGRARFEEAGRELGGATMATIHGFLMQALRQVAPPLGLDPDFAAFGEGEARATYEDELRSLAFLTHDLGHPLAAPLARLGADGPAELLALFEQRSLALDLRPVDDGASDLWAVHQAAYERWLTRCLPTRLAPSEIERLALRAAEAPALAARIVARAPVLLVDEFQDVNPLQGRLFEALERAGAHVEVVGDPKQSIYGFRHADVEVFRRAAAAAAAAGTLAPPLIDTRRHAPEIAGLLNLLTGTLAESGLGFEPAEAPDVRTVGSAAAVTGLVELHWWRDDDGDPARLREAEFAFLGDRLHALAAAGRPWSHMAVVARAHASLAAVEAALRAAGVPAVLRQGRGYFERPELRDLLHAVRVALDPRGLSLAAWLRGPFGQLDPAAAAAVARADDPEAALRAGLPALAERLGTLRAALLADPTHAVATLAYAPLIDGTPFVARLTPRARDNVDALVVALAERPPADLERLLDRFERMAREADAGDVPQAGEGVTLLTVHAAKGLEWPVVAVVDAGRGRYEPAPPLVVDARDGRLARQGSPGYVELERERRRRADGETWRSLYVALSRPREVLLVTGSQARQGPGPWLQAFHRLRLGPAVPGAAAEADRRGGAPPHRGRAHASAVARALGVQLVQHGGGGEGPRSAGAPPLRPAYEPAPWLGRLPRPAPFPAVVSPSWVALEGVGRAAEPRVRAAWPAPLHACDAEEDDERRAPDPEDGERLAGRGATVGTLVHDALARGRRLEAAADLAELAGQEVLFAFPREAHASILDEVGMLVAGFWALVDGGALPAPGAGDEDEPEWPFVFEAAGSTWQGVIDRVLRVGERWWLDDFKTDRHLDPLRYAFPLATYVHAVELVRGVRPEARLIDLRRRRVVVVPDAALRAAWIERVGG
jgi:ATP-dependent helicase/nuclease subunit A